MRRAESIAIGGVLCLAALANVRAEGWTVATQACYASGGLSGSKRTIPAGVRRADHRTAPPPVATIRPYRAYEVSALLPAGLSSMHGALALAFVEPRRPRASTPLSLRRPAPAGFRG